MSYLLLLTENVSYKPSLSIGTLSTLAEKRELWDYYKAISFRHIVKEILQCWPITEEYEDVISLNPVIWIKNGVEYLTVCLDRDRIDLTNAQLVSERDDIALAGVPIFGTIVDDPVAWAAANGYSPLEG